MLRNLFAVAFLAISIFFIGCKGDDGAVGPAGPKGEIGPQGPKGDSGVAGQNGTNGIGARVLATGPVKTTGGSYTVGKSNLSRADSIFIANSIVQVYVFAVHKTFNQARSYTVPGKAYWDTNDWTSFQVFSLMRNARVYVSLTSDTWSGDQSTAPEREFADIRAVFIPATYFRANGEVDYSNYEETMKSLGLTEADVVKAN